MRSRRTMTAAAPRARACVVMNGGKKSSSKFAEPEPPNDGDKNDKDLLADLKKVRAKQIEDKKKMIEAMKLEYGELKDADDLMFVSFDEPKEDRQPVTFDRNEYKLMLERLENEKKELENPKASTGE